MTRRRSAGRGGTARGPATGDEGPMVVYGRNPVREALRGRRRVRRIWATEQLAVEVAPASRADLPLSIVDRQGLERLTASREHQGIACEVDPYPYAEASTLLHHEQALVVALDQVQDPQNLGAVCRSAECAGASGVVVPERRSARVTPAVCRASAGAVEHLALARVRNLAEFLATAKQAGAWVYGAEAGAATPYTEPDYRGPVVLVLGAEGSGLRPRVRAACDQVVSLPLRGRLGSLNLSAAAAILLYEVLRRRAP